MATVEGDRNRSLGQQLLKADHLSRSRRAGRNGGIGSPICGADFTGAVLPKPLDEPIHRGGKFRPLLVLIVSAKAAKLLVASIHPYRDTRLNATSQGLPLPILPIIASAPSRGIGLSGPRIALA